MLALRPRRRPDSEPDLAPLMDVIFILLIFFIIASAFAVRGLDIDLPSAHSSQALSGRVVEVRLEKDGSFLCDGVPVERDFLRYKLWISCAVSGRGRGNSCSRPTPKRRWRR